MGDIVNFQISHVADYMTVSDVFPDGQNYVYISVLNEDGAPLSEGHSLHVRVDQPDVLLGLYAISSDELLMGPVPEIDYEFTQSEEEGAMIFYVKPFSPVSQKLVISAFVDQDEAAAKVISSNCYSYDEVFNVDYVIQSHTEYGDIVQRFIEPDLLPDEDRVFFLQFDLVSVAAVEPKTVTVKASLEGGDFEFLDDENNLVGKTSEFEVDSGVAHKLNCKFHALGNGVVRYQVDGFEEVSSVLRVMDIKYMHPPRDLHSYVEKMHAENLCLKDRVSHA